MAERTATECWAWSPAVGPPGCAAHGSCALRKLEAPHDPFCDGQFENPSECWRHEADRADRVEEQLAELRVAVEKARARLRCAKDTALAVPDLRQSRDRWREVQSLVSHLDIALRALGGKAAAE